jgi:hypothetical protein
MHICVNGLGLGVVVWVRQVVAWRGGRRGGQSRSDRARLRELRKRIPFFVDAGFASAKMPHLLLDHMPFGTFMN